MKTRYILPLAVLLACLSQGCEQNPFSPDFGTPAVPELKQITFVGSEMAFWVFSSDRDIEFFRLESTHSSGPILTPRSLELSEKQSEGPMMGPQNPGQARMISLDFEQFGNLNYWYENGTRYLKVRCTPARTNTLAGVPDGLPPSLLDMILLPGQTRDKVSIFVLAEDLGPGMMFTEWVSLFAVDKWGNVGEPLVKEMNLAYINIEMTSDVNPAVMIYGFFGQLNGSGYEVALYPDLQVMEQDKYTLDGTWTITYCSLEDLEYPHQTAGFAASGGVYSGTSIPVISGFYLGAP